MDDTWDPRPAISWSPGDLGGYPAATNIERSFKIRENSTTPRESPGAPHGPLMVELVVLPPAPAFCAQRAEDRIPQIRSRFTPFALWEWLAMHTARICRGGARVGLIVAEMGPCASDARVHAGCVCATDPADWRV